jgi:preprotein translocase subunit SecA
MNMFAQRSETTAVRPGSLLGLYPERPERHGRERTREAPAHARALRAPFEQGLKLIEEHGRPLRGVSDRRLLDSLRYLRSRLLQEGLSTELCARTFAIAREAAGRRLGMRPFTVQLHGGWVMLQGRIAEMETGEGKTLTASLPASAAALAGIPVHVITVNDYLAQRDAELLAPLYQGLGLSVGVVTEGLDPQARRAAYACDITYCTNKQLVFDYLRDRVMLGADRSTLRLRIERLYETHGRTPRLLLRGLCYGIVDEADSILIDEARTPLILAQSREATDEQQLYTEALELVSRLEPNRDFSLHARERSVELRDRGRARLAELADSLAGAWQMPLAREELARQALSALHLFHRDKHYLVRDGQIQIIDEYTGRVMQDRAWERGLHQMIEVKEGCELSALRETLARISYQRFFRRYLLLAGMTGTAREVAPELKSVYRLQTVKIPTNRPMRRECYQDRVYLTEADKWRCITERVCTLHRRGRPVLVGTRSVDASERLSRLLNEANLPHQMLTARQDLDEATIVARAGERGRITVATNMAGRGTDIKLQDDVRSLGGLHVIASERHEAGRIDRQLFGRCGRQGDRGSYESVTSLEDELIRHYCPGSLRALATLAGRRGHPLARWLGQRIYQTAQRRAERHHARVRRHLLKADQRLDSMLGFSGRLE